MGISTESQVIWMHELPIGGKIGRDPLASGDSGPGAAGCLRQPRRRLAKESRSRSTSACR